MKPKVIHTKTFSCDDDHPIVWYTFDETNKALCGYCAAQFVYEEEDFHPKMQEETGTIDNYVNKRFHQAEGRENLHPKRCRTNWKIHWGLCKYFEMDNED